MFVLPEALNKTILARLTSPAGRDRELARLSSCSRCSGRKTNSAFGRPMAIGTPIVHWRCPFSQQYYCHLFMGHNTSDRSSLRMLAHKVGTSMESAEQFIRYVPWSPAE